MQWVRIDSSPPRRDGRRCKMGTWALKRDGRFTVTHCGHPTALYPWIVVVPDPAGRPVTLRAPNGRAFSSVKAAKGAAELHYFREVAGGAEEPVRPRLWALPSPQLMLGFTEEWF